VYIFNYKMFHQEASVETIKLNILMLYIRYIFNKMFILINNL